MAIWWAKKNSPQEVFCERGALRNFTKFIGKYQMFSCDFYKISKNTFSYRTPSVAASDKS